MIDPLNIIKKTAAKQKQKVTQQSPAMPILSPSNSQSKEYVSFFSAQKTHTLSMVGEDPQLKKNC